MRERGQTNNNRWSVGPVSESDYNQVSRLVVTDHHSSDTNHQNHHASDNNPVLGKPKTAPTKPTRQLTTSVLPSSESTERNSQSNGSQISQKMYKTHSHAHFNPSLSQEKQQQRERSVTRKSSQVQRSSSRVSSASSLVRWPFHKVKGLGSNLSLNATAKGEKI